MVEVFLFVIEAGHLLDLRFEIVKFGNVGLQDLHKVFQAIVLLVEGMHMLFKSFRLFSLNFLQLLGLFQELFLFG